MLRLMVMGSPVLIRDGVALDGASNAQRRIAFMSMLACAGADRGVARDRLLLLFWPEKTEAQGRNALKQLTFALRRDLAAPDLFLGTCELRLNAAVITSDVGDFLSAAQSGDWETATSA